MTANNKIFIGCSGFSNRDWKGLLYPEDTAAKDYLKVYSQKFNAVEINSTFYRRPMAKTLENWYNLSAEDFNFFIKIPKTITHIKKLQNTKEEVQIFCDHISEGLKEKLSGFLFQMPPSFHYSVAHLEQLCESVDSRYHNVVEFRHNSWWREEVFKILHDNNIVFSGVSIPKDIPEEVINNNDSTLYYRLHGKPVMFKSAYSEEFLMQLAEDIKKCNITAYILFNNTWGDAAIKNALFLKSLLK